MRVSTMNRSHIFYEDRKRTIYATEYESTGAIRTKRVNLVDYPRIDFSSISIDILKRTKYTVFSDGSAISFAASSNLSHARILEDALGETQKYQEGMHLRYNDWRQVFAPSASSEKIKLSRKQYRALVDYLERFQRAGLGHVEFSLDFGNGRRGTIDLLSDIDGVLIFLGDIKQSLLESKLPSLL